MEIKFNTGKLKGLLLYEDGGKLSVNRRRIFNIMLLIIIGVMCGNIFLRESPDTSSVETRVKTHRGSQKASPKGAISYGSGEKLPNTETESKTGKKTWKRAKKLKLRAKQVLLNSESKIGKIPLGTSAVGELLTTIDSRDSGQIIRVRLPYGMKSSRKQILPRQSILLGKATYNQGNNRAYISFFSMVDSNGNEAPITAQALDSKDFATGIVGNVHSNKGIKIATSVALNVISGAAGFAQQRAQGIAGVETPKFNADNALLSGASTTARDEANAISSEVRSSEDYITVEAGSDLIVMLTNTFKGGVQ